MQGMQDMGIQDCNPQAPPLGAKPAEEMINVMSVMSVMNVMSVMRVMSVGFLLYLQWGLSTSGFQSQGSSWFSTRSHNSRWGLGALGSRGVMVCASKRGSIASRARFASSFLYLASSRSRSNTFLVCSCPTWCMCARVPSLTFNAYLAYIQRLLTLPPAVPQVCVCMCVSVSVCVYARAQAGVCLCMCVCVRACVSLK